MALPESSEDKTEQATPKKRKDQRKEGNILQSKEISTAVTLIAAFYGFSFLFTFMSGNLQSFLTRCFEMIPHTEQFGAGDASALFIRCALSFGLIALPILLITGLCGIIAGLAQTRGFFGFKQLAPKFSKMNPIEGFKRLFSLKGFVELLKSILKIIILLFVIYSVIKDELPEMSKLIDMDLMSVVDYAGGVLMAIINRVVIAFVFLAAADFLYQRWQYEKNLRMTKQEVKEEYKNTEGDPQIKGKIKSKQQEMARRRMMQQVPEANVIIRNPTHFAVALKYDPEKHAAPLVVAKGQDMIALRIVAVAEEHGVPCIENKPLARELYDKVDLDREIPKEFYNAVAEVIAYIYGLQKKGIDSLE